MSKLTGWCFPVWTARSPLVLAGDVFGLIVNQARREPEPEGRASPGPPPFRSGCPDASRLRRSPVGMTAHRVDCGSLGSRTATRESYVRQNHGKLDDHANDRQEKHARESQPSMGAHEPGNDEPGKAAGYQGAEENPKRHISEPDLTLNRARQFRGLLRRGVARPACWTMLHRDGCWT